MKENVCNFVFKIRVWMSMCRFCKQLLHSSMWVYFIKSRNVMNLQERIDFPGYRHNPAVNWNFYRISS